MTPIEKVAKAICVADGYDPDQSGARGGLRWYNYMEAARAALAAIREPSEAMIAAMEGLTDFYFSEMVPNVKVARAKMDTTWIAAIDAALKEGP